MSNQTQESVMRELIGCGRKVLMGKHDDENDVQDDRKGLNASNGCILGDIG